MAFQFERLEVWKRAIKLAKKVFEITRQFPKEEQFGLTSQIRRAATSVGLNIAEGSARGTKKEFQYFLRIAKGSLGELTTGMAIAREFEYLDNVIFKDVYRESDEIARMISGLSKNPCGFA